MAQKFKTGFKFRHNADDVEIIDRQGKFVLAKISGTTVTFFDISAVQLDHHGNEHFQPSVNGNGLTAEGEIGQQRVPLSLEVMTLKFGDYVKEQLEAEKNQREAAEAREQAFDTRLWRIRTAKEKRAEAEQVIVEGIKRAKSVDAALSDRRIRQAVEEIQTINFLLPYIR